jgi:hypothetical protein
VLKYNYQKKESRKNKMQVIVTKLDMTQETYGYSPEHYADVVEYYSELVQSGKIYTYTARM